MAPPRIPNPRHIPVTGTDAHLPAVASRALTAAALRQRFQHIAEWQPELAGDGRLFTDRPPAHAAVLVPLVQRDDGLHVLLTRRTEQLRDHAGQVSFPGGRTEAFDDGPVATALREAQEEVGLAPTQVEVIGQMPTYSTVTSFIVTPVVGLITPPLALQVDSREVAEAFEVPLSFLMNPAQHQRHIFEYDGGQRQFLSMPWQGQLADGSMREYFIWGATAAMLRNLYQLLSGPLPE
jgi:8-oxo-dGTP pyrophosphatase MutT (NUDIX family)